MRQSQFIIQKSKNQTHFPAWHLGQRGAGASLPAGDREGQRKARGGEEGAGHRGVTAGSGCPALRGAARPAAPSGCARLRRSIPARLIQPSEGQAPAHHFSFFSSPSDAEASAPSLDSVTADGSLGFDSS